jgi:hypothetical protein
MLGYADEAGFCDGLFCLTGLGNALHRTVLNKSLEI